MIRAASVRTDGLASWEGAHPAITIACAWCPIMWNMKETSAAVYGRRTLSALARATAAAAPCASTAGPEEGEGEDRGATCRDAPLQAVDASPTPRAAASCRAWAWVAVMREPVSRGPRGNASSRVPREGAPAPRRDR